MPRTLLRFLVVVAFAACAIACSKTYIPNTDVEDTGVNREVIEFCENYRHALEDRNVPQLTVKAKMVAAMMPGSATGMKMRNSICR